MQALRVPASAGFGWLLRSFVLWRRAPLQLTAASMTLVMCLLLATVIPLVGELAFHILLAALGVGLFTCFQAIAAGRPAPPGLLFAAFFARSRRLIGLAVLRLAGDLLCVTLAMQISGLDLAQFAQLASSEGETLALFARQAAYTVMWTMLLRSPLDLLTWFAAPLVVLHRLPLRKALFFSFVAGWRNLSALLVFLLGFGVLSLALGFALSLLGAALPALTSWLLPPLMMLLVPLFYGAFYFSACDIFGEWPRP